MATTYFELIKRVRYELGGVKQGTAEAGSDADTIVDSNRYETNSDRFNRGQIFITSTTDGAAPQGEVRMVATTGHSATTGTYKANSPFSAAVEAGDDYWIAPGKYKLDDIKAGINRVLQSLETIGRDTSLTFQDDTMKYDLPTGVAEKDLLQVHLQIDDDPVEWQEHANWKFAGSGELVLYGFNQASIYDANTILLKYLATPATLSADDDELDNYIHPELVVYETARRLLFQHITEVGQTPADDPNYVHFADLARKAKARHKQHLPERPLKGSGLGMPSESDTDI